ncbi:divergent PAP2 family protein [Anaeromicrobium sediminis]|uniref:Acid phosphatase n=1 Tax=Anaeromicrobium sediminis TaxID=1478221 RepID=A0A267MQG7_9FIRM|nr:divergent PAP2 family protein [Anaeromicrobium sediminis]PAB60970.1 hypothetical protein CCE28_00625 [Anaeromicrobium sediminis]
MLFIHELINNEIISVTFIAWFIAQILKVILTLITDKKFDVYRFVGSGGMPSSHSALVMALSTAVGLKKGWGSVEYAISLAVAMVVMYDASGVRRSVGKQAMILNKIIADKHNHKSLKEIREKRLKELIGHTPIEVFAGALLGILIANVVM